MTFRTILLAAIASSACTLLPDGAFAASFACAKAVLPAETAICANANLSRLDEATTGMYFLIVGSNGPDATVSKVKESQRSFISTRDACGADINCLVDAYTSQMMFLRNVKSELGL